MILSYEDLKKYEKKVVMVDGCFDPLHIGHATYFKEAARFGLPVLCNVQSDRYINERKKRANLLPEEQRIQVIDAMRDVSYVHLCKTTTDDILSKLQPVKYIKGLDWKTTGLPQAEQETCKRFGIEIAYLDTNIDSSTNIVQNFTEKMLKKSEPVSISAFESFVLSQKKVDAVQYDDEYFKGDWRVGENTYSLENRRKIEAKNPQNIKDVFNPKLVLDIGCGPGALMFFLYELGVEGYGIDISSSAKEMAPPEVKSHIVIAPVTEYHDFGLNFDLVICRELLEHLTVLEVRKAVKVLAEYTSKYLYVTTRFHPSPSGLLDVTDDFANDPTHITALNKDFLRTLFVLEGLKSRPDLEEKLDWKKFGRVLVFEKV